MPFRQPPHVTRCTFYTSILEVYICYSLVVTHM
jgi:hypothetical protein